MTIIHQVSQEALNLINEVEKTDAQINKTLGVIAGIFKKAEGKK